MYTYLLTGLLLVAYAFTTSGCAFSKPGFPTQETVANPASPSASPSALPFASVEEARDALRVARIAEYREVWGDAELDDMTRGLVAFGMAQETETTAWSNEAVGIFGRLVKQDPSNAQARAYLGSSHALIARDYPIRGLWQVFPGPGFIRLYHVNRGFKHVNQAVEQDPRDPVVRLVRASTLMGLSAFGGTKKGMEDFDLLQSWVEDEATNPEHRDVIASRTFQVELLLAYAGALERLDRKDEAASVWQRIMAMSGDARIRNLAAQKLP